MKEIETRGLTAGSIFKILLIGYVFSVGLLIIFLGILSLFGVELGHEQPVTGFKGFLLALVMAPFVVLGSTASAWVPVAIGSWLYSHWLHRQSQSITIYYKPAND